MCPVVFTQSTVVTILGSCQPQSTPSFSRPPGHSLAGPDLLVPISSLRSQPFHLRKQGWYTNWLAAGDDESKRMEAWPAIINNNQQ